MICSIDLLTTQANVSEVMVSRGFAIPYFFFIPSDQKEKWTSLARLAKEGRLGLWESHYNVMDCMLEQAN